MVCWNVPTDGILGTHPCRRLAVDLDAIGDGPGANAQRGLHRRASSGVETRPVGPVRRRRAPRPRSACAHLPGKTEG